MEENIRETSEVEAAYRDALGEPPPQLSKDFCGSVFAATTRRRHAPSPFTGRRLALAGAAAAAGAAALVVLNKHGAQEPDEETLELASLDLELLDELELSADLDAVELLELLEDMDNG